MSRRETIDPRLWIAAAVVLVAFVFVQRPHQPRFPELPPLENQRDLWPPDLRYPICIPKIYVYGLPEHLRLPESAVSKCRWSPYSSYQHLLSILQDNEHISFTYLTDDPSIATHFLIPVDPACYLFNCWDSNPGWDQSLRCDVDRAYLKPALDWVLQQPWWNRTDGADHIMFHQMDHRDSYYSEEVKKVMGSAIYFTTVGDLRAGSHTYSGYRRHRDIVIPSITYLLHSYYVNPRDYLAEDGKPLKTISVPPSQPTTVEIYQPYYDPASATKRKTSTIFRGLGSHPKEQYSLGIRSLFFNSTTGEHPGFSSIPGFDIAHSSENEDYAQALANSKFGLTPPGHTLDTTRIWEYLAFGVVPVLIGTEGLVLPFSDDIDWDAMVVKISRREAHRTPEILEAISEETYERKSAYVWNVGRQAVIEPRKGLVWHYIARSLCRTTPQKFQEENIYISIPEYKYYGF